MYYIVCGLPDLNVSELTLLVKHARAALVTVLAFTGTDDITRRDAFMLERTLAPALEKLAPVAGTARAASVVDQAAVCNAVTGAWKLTSDGPAAGYVATVLARAALEGLTEKIASSRVPVAQSGSGRDHDWAAAAVIAVASTAAAMAVAATVAFVWGRAKKQLAPRRRR